MRQTRIENQILDVTDKIALVSFWTLVLVVIGLLSRSWLLTIVAMVILFILDIMHRKDSTNYAK